MSEVPLYATNSNAAIAGITRAGIAIQKCIDTGMIDSHRPTEPQTRRVAHALRLGYDGPSPQVGAMRRKSPCVDVLACGTRTASAHFSHPRSDKVQGELQLHVSPHEG